MHTYSTDVSRSPKLYFLVAAASIAAAWILGLLFNWLGFTPPWWLDTPATLGFFGAFWTLYDQQLWRLHLGKHRLAGIPDLSGQWNGTIESNFAGGTQIPCTVDIRQTSTKILLKLDTGTSRSNSMMASIRTDPSLRGVHYEYTSQPKTLSSRSMHPHKGRAHLDWNDDFSTLEGEYETDHRRGNEGRIRLRRSSTGVTPS
ncbi:hypothetical protein [Amycolatopsis nivea]|uniref:Cap15 family cyclic dinucleotide receptor domain-containing protein n=1 Tax=Amycolatopsis nivea TaxID=1644109 RepID=UPI001430379D